MSSALKKWINETPERRRAYEQECLIVETSEAIWKAMEESGVSKVALAERLGTSKGNVTQLLSGSRNMTVRTLADIAMALGYKVSVRLERPTLETSPARTTCNHPEGARSLTNRCLICDTQVVEQG